MTAPAAPAGLAAGTLDGLLAAAAAASPDRPATILAGRGGFETMSYAELDARVDAVAAGLLHAGLGPRVRTALLVPPTADFFVLAFALLRLRAVPVLIDPGIGRRHLRTCLAEAAPGAFIGVPRAHAARRLLGWGPTARLAVVVGSPLPGASTLAAVERAGRARLPLRPPPREPSAAAAILYTSGSTGPPKGVEYREEQFLAQVRLVRDLYDVGADEVSLATFPPFALFGPALGMTTVVPPMDPTRPARVNPRRLVQTANRYGATLMFASPALLDTVGRWAERGGASIPTLRRVISAGAPVSRAVQQRIVAMLPPGAQVHTPYGATEALPVTSIGSVEIASLPAAGICVGRPVPGVDVVLIRVSDAPLTRLDSELVVGPGEVGEVVVRGPNVSVAYADRPAANLLGKLDWEGRVAHRMGDLAVRDDDGRLWFQGRKAHRVHTAAGPMDTTPVEEVFNRHARVRRSALVGVGAPGSQRPVICIELERPRRPSAALTAELLSLAAADPRTAGIETVRYLRSFPVDVRHNAKIDRGELARRVADRR